MTPELGSVFAPMAENKVTNEFIEDFKTWRVWSGAEVEGNNSTIGRITLFIRNFTPDEKELVMWQLLKVKSVWFCKEFTDYDFIRRVIQEGAHEVKVEATLETIKALPMSIRQKARIFLKIPEPTDMPLKDQDFVCIGDAYWDVALSIRDGLRVAVGKYSNDTKIL